MPDLVLNVLNEQATVKKNLCEVGFEPASTRRWLKVLGDIVTDGPRGRGIYGDLTIRSM